MNEKKIVRVRDVMNTGFQIIDGKVTVSQALHTMKQHRTTVLVVAKRHADDEIGMVTVGDIARKVLALDRSPERVNVYEIMKKPVITIDPDMDIRYCSRLFAEFELHRAPVTEKGEVLGLIGPASLVLDGLAPLYID